jgi:hypothetical protein
LLAAVTLVHEENRERTKGFHWQERIAPRWLESRCCGVEFCSSRFQRKNRRQSAPLHEIKLTVTTETGAAWLIWRKSDAVYFDLEPFNNSVWLRERDYGAPHTPAARYCSLQSQHELRAT